MKVVIVEDEPLTAKDLEACILAAEPSAEVVATLASVEEAIGYFKAHAAPDLIFSDIQLGDGLSFPIFEASEQVVPVIFCTAYDEYALEAFRAAGIDYVLKPFTTKSIAAALAKYNAFRSRWAAPAYGGLAGLFGQDPGKRSILVHYKDKIMPVALADIALFYLKNESVRLVTFTKQQYVVGKKLEELERIGGSMFYRVNRQCLVSREAIKDVAQDGGRRLLVNLMVPLEEKVMVGRLKVSDFLAWLEGTR